MLPVAAQSYRIWSPASSGWYHSGGADKWLDWVSYNCDTTNTCSVVCPIMELIKLVCMPLEPICNWNDSYNYNYYYYNYSSLSRLNSTCFYNLPKQQINIVPARFVSQLSHCNSIRSWRKGQKAVRLGDLRHVISRTRRSLSLHHSRHLDGYDEAKAKLPSNRLLICRIWLGRAS